MLLFFITPFILYIILVICSWVAEVMCNKSSLSLSTTMTSLVKQYNFREEVVDISGITIHSVIKDPTGVIPSHHDDVFVFIHGTASSSVIFFNLMNQIPADIKCIAIDLPSFGISGDIDIDMYPTNKELCIHYANVIGQTLDKMGILDKTILVGHSLGGFLSIYVAAQYPIKKLVLLNPAGILPTLGVFGYYWAIFFKLGLPTTIFNLPLISRNGMKRIITTFFHDDSILTQFWLSFYSNPRNNGHQVLQRVITFTPCYSYWNTPSFPLLIEVCKKIPTTVCFGVKDTICPSHIGSFLKYVSCGQIMIHNIHDANHNPCVNTAEMTKLLKSILTNQREGTVGITIHKPNNTTFHRGCKGYSYPSLTKTQNSIDQIYKYLLTNTT
jgi:pimeloyl-ACP methyl ester carboxylesterase